MGRRKPFKRTAMTKRDHEEAYARLRRQGVPERLLAMQMGLTPADVQEFEAARNAVPLERPLPEGYVIPGDDAAEMENKMKTKVYYSRGLNPKSDGLIQVDDAVAKALGSNLCHVNPTKTLRAEGAAVHNNPTVLTTYDPKTRIVTVTPYKGAGRVVIGALKKCRLPWRIPAPAELGTPDARSTVIEAEFQEGKLTFTLPADMDPGILAPRTKKNEAAVDVKDEAPDAGTNFNTFMDVLLKAGQRLNRRHFFMAEDGVTKVWADGSSLGYEQLEEPVTVIDRAELRGWLKGKGDAGRKLLADFLDAYDLKPMDRRGFVAWLALMDADDLSDAAAKDFR